MKEIEILRASAINTYAKAWREFEEKSKPYLDPIARWVDNWLMLIEEAFFSKEWEKKYENETTDEDI